ncbi:MAG TPA: PIN domain-containing protein [Candidatus Limnocylindria bacterium]
MYRPRCHTRRGRSQAWGGSRTQDTTPLKAAWLDANVIVRLLTDQPRDLAAKAQALMRRAERGELVLRLSVVVVAEVVWVLSRRYSHTKEQIAGSIQLVITADGIDVEAADDVLDALQMMVDQNVDFVDAYLAAVAKRRRESVATFDSDFRKLGARVVAL